MNFILFRLKMSMNVLIILDLLVVDGLVVVLMMVQQSDY